MKSSVRARNLIAGCALAATSATAVAEVWIETSRSDDYIAYGDPSSIRREGDISRMASMFDYKKPQAGIPGKTYFSTKRIYEYDCKQDRARPLTVSSYSAHDAKGDTLASVSVNYNWSAVVRDSADAYLLKFACTRYDASQGKLPGK